MEQLSTSELSVNQENFEVSLDPLEWIHSDVHELLFQHFNPEDSLRASEVSRAWNKSTESSLKCWEKLELNINWKKIEEINRPIAEDFKSSRKYQKLRLSWICDVSGLMSVIQGRKWKSVKMDFFDCELDQQKEILKVVEPTVETLHIEFTVFRSSSSNTKLKYPKLKDLRLEFCEGLTLEAVTGDCKTLEKLHLKFSNPAVNDISFLSLLDKILENNAKLKELSYWTYNKAPFPIRSMLNHQFKLKSLFLNSRWGWVDVEDRFLSFLKSQANNLEDLELQSSTSLETIKTVLKMPKLKKVALLLLDDQLIAGWNNVHLIQNPAIEDFKLDFYFELNENITEFMGKMFQSIPNCQKLYVRRLNVLALRSLAQHCPRIKKLVVDYLEVQNIDELPEFPAIEVFRFPLFIINETLKTQIRAKPAETRTRLEKLILQALEKKKQWE